MVYTATTTTVALYQNLQVTLAAPAIGTSGVLQGAQYSVRLTIGATNSQYDLLDVNQSLLASSVSVPTPHRHAHAAARQRLLRQLHRRRRADDGLVRPGLPHRRPVTAHRRQLQRQHDPQRRRQRRARLPLSRSRTARSSSTPTSTSTPAPSARSAPHNVYLASAVINSAPDDTTSAAFAPSHAPHGTRAPGPDGHRAEVRLRPRGRQRRHRRHALHAQRHQPRGPRRRSRTRCPTRPSTGRRTSTGSSPIATTPTSTSRYTGATEADRISQAQSDVARIGLATAQAQEPMQMYLDTSGDDRLAHLRVPLRRPRPRPSTRASSR